MYPVYPYISPRCPCVVISPLCFWWVSVVDGCDQGNEVSRGVGCLWEPCHAYLKRLSPASSSHWGRCTLIRYASTQNTCARIIVGLFPLGGQATSYIFEGFRCLHPQQYIHRIWTLIEILDFACIISTRYNTNIWNFYFIFKCNSLISLYWSFGVFYSRGYRCALYPLPCHNGAPMYFILVPMPPLSVYSCVVIGFGMMYVGGWGGFWGGWVIGWGLVPGALTWRGSALRRLPTGAAVRWSGATASWIPVCSGEWCASKWLQSYSWRTRTS